MLATEVRVDKALGCRSTYLGENLLKVIDAEDRLHIGREVLAWVHHLGDQVF